MTTAYQLLPPLTDEGRAALRDDIAEHGVQQPIVVDEHGTIIDGHHRQAIADELGVACPRSVYPGYSDEEKRSLALRLNLHRRQLTTAQRNELIVALRREGMTQQEIAKAVGVSVGTVNGALKFSPENEGGPETITNTRGQQRPTRYDRRPRPGDDFTDDQGETRRVAEVQEHGDDIIVLDEDGDAVIVPDPEAPDPGDDPPTPAERQLAPPVPERQRYEVPKPDLGDGVSHPARYSPELLDLFRDLLAAYSHAGARILDPFAGTGRIHQLGEHGYDTAGVELEPEWANLHPRTLTGSALELPVEDATVDAIVTSPTYGNRLADSHDASDPESRRSYTHDLGRPLHEDNSGTLHWRTTAPGAGAMGSFDYRNFHGLAWTEALRVLTPGGLFVLNMCDHVRDSLVQPVTAWHTWCLGRLGLEWVESRSVATRKLRQGANGELREQEQVHVFRRPA
jgi:transcriptional regulator with XRE-family HTH domain